jgi:hypothetical protein
LAKPISSNVQTRIKADWHWFESYMNITFFPKPYFAYLATGEMIYKENSQDFDFFIIKNNN